MKKVMLFLVLLLVFGVFTITSVFAITYGTPDGNRHPAVGAMVAWNADGTLRARCSGSLIASRVFLTAAHCGVITPVLVSFDEHLNPAAGIYTGTFVADPQYTGNGDSRSDNHDIAVIRLDSAPGLTPAKLPTLGQFDGIGGNNRTLQITAVGFGLSEPTIVPGQGVVLTRLNARFYAVSSVNTVSPFYFHNSQNIAHGDAGACFGDSGGPNFAGAGSEETDVIAGTTITGDAICRATNDVYRLDIESPRAFLASMGIALP